MRITVLTRSDVRTAHDEPSIAACSHESRRTLSGTVADVWHARGYEVFASTHAGAARLVGSQDKVDFLIAARPAPRENHAGYHVEDAEERPVPSCGHHAMRPENRPGVRLPVPWPVNPLDGRQLAHCHG
jgi:hypothetical protein